MIYVERNDLVVDRIYTDVEPTFSSATFLKFEKRTKKYLYFSYVGGADSYEKNENGFIKFENDNGFSGFYEKI